jgi:hypothetical protein
MREIPLLEAKCASCGRLFSHPSLGDFSYGEAVLCSVDGKHHATIDAFGDFAQRVKALLNSSVAGSLWPLLASLADPVAGQPWAHTIHCPHCTSNSLEYWSGQKIGISSVPAATFIASSSLSPESLARVVAGYGHEA